jgi:hypothetical protein
MAASIPALTCVSTHRRFDRLGCYAKRIRGLENGTWFPRPVGIAQFQCKRKNAIAEIQ